LPGDLSLLDAVVDWLMCDGGLAIVAISCQFVWHWLVVPLSSLPRRSLASLATPRHAYATLIVVGGAAFAQVALQALFCAA
jgi:hypothetical protein